MDVTRDSSQRPDNLANALIRPLPDPPVGGAIPLTKMAKLPLDPLARRSAPRTVLDPLDGPAAEPMTVQAVPPVQPVQPIPPVQPVQPVLPLGAARPEEETVVRATTTRRPRAPIPRCGSAVRWRCPGGSGSSSYW